MSLHINFLNLLVALINKISYTILKNNYFLFFFRNLIFLKLRKLCLFNTKNKYITQYFSYNKTKFYFKIS
jgi:hypothetical protein